MIHDEWKVVYLEQAEKDLHSIHYYIAKDLLSPENADGQVRRIRDAVSKLDHMPYRFHLFQREPWKSRGMRMMPVDRYVVFYMPIEDKGIVAIFRILYGGMDAARHL